MDKMRRPTLRPRITASPMGSTQRSKREADRTDDRAQSVMMITGESPCNPEYYCGLDASATADQTIMLRIAVSFIKVPKAGSTTDDCSLPPEPFTLRITCKAMADISVCSKRTCKLHHDDDVARSMRATALMVKPFLIAAAVIPATSSYVGASSDRHIKKRHFLDSPIATQCHTEPAAH